MAEKTIKALVAEGRTILHETSRKIAGEAVELLESEFQRLKALGFVTSIDKAPVTTASDHDTPTVSVKSETDPVTVKAG